MLVQSVTRMWGVDGGRRKPERQLVYVQSLLADAEAKAETNDAVRAWMKKSLKAVAYQADDVLVDFQYEALRRQAPSRPVNGEQGTSNLTSKSLSKVHGEQDGEQQPQNSEALLSWGCDTLCLKTLKLFPS